MFYSKSTSGFYDSTIHGDNIPADAVEITKVEYAALIGAQVTGKSIQADSKGKPVAVDPPPPSPADHARDKATVLKQARDIREVVLGRLDGIAGRATRSGDTTGIAAACDATALALLDLTSDAGVVAAITGAETKAAIMSRWQTIATTLAATSPYAASVFVGMGMS